MDVRILAPAGLSGLVASRTPLLGVVGFGAERPVDLPAACPFVGLPLPCLSGTRLEVWTGAGLSERHDRSGLILSRNDGVLFGAVAMREADFHGLAELASSLYGRIFQALAETGCPTLLRVFNYLPRITDGGAQGIERYREFNRGRHDAFAAAGRAVADAPAASALGLPCAEAAQGAASTVYVYFLASDGDAMPVENSRQVSAYAYPDQYGPKSPVFSRATITRLPAKKGHEPWLFVSGTASIVGHGSLHPTDPAAQTAEIVRNLAALVSACRSRGFAPAEALRLKAYVRHPADRETVAGQLRQAGLEAVFLQADICRPELLVEIEALARLEAVQSTH